MTVTDTLIEKLSRIQTSTPAHTELSTVIGKYLSLLSKQELDERIASLELNGNIQHAAQVQQLFDPINASMKLITNWDE